jgi:hypothetical protein
MKSVAPGQKLSVFANEKPVTTVDVGKERAAYDFTLPAAALTLGENRVRLTFRNAAAIAGGKRSAAAIESIEIGPAKAAAAARLFAWARQSGRASIWAASRRWRCRLPRPRAFPTICKFRPRPSWRWPTARPSPA